ncbi:MAG: hypothetical protein IT324_21345 [Anaerolineae bacterium]|nr:hypothetical protein [Anaerolineae bacterium]
MTERMVLVQCVITQRTERPAGFRIWTDGLVQRPAPDNSLPNATERLDLDRSLAWQDERRLSAAQINTIRETIHQIQFFDLPPRLLINYCKEDPGTAIWTVNVDGQTGRVVVFDPRPRRSEALDMLSKHISDIIGR